MRSLRPNQNGIIVPTQQTIKHGGQITPYTKPTKALHNVERLMTGSKPVLAITRRQGGIGDVLMTLPTVKAISRKYNIQITYGTDFEYLDGALPAVLQGNPFISNIVPWREIAPDDFSAVMDLTCPCVAHEVPLAKPINRIDLFGNHLGIQIEDPSIDYYITNEERAWAKEYIYENQLDRFARILVQPSSSTTNRDMPLPKMKEALTEILKEQKDARAIVITHNSDNIKTEWKYSDVHCVHNLGVRKIAAIMEQCHMVLCPDSAILHLASALHMPTVTLFGPTDPRARVNYHPEAVAIWPAGRLRNYPCWYSNPNDGYMCWKLIEPSFIKEISLCVLNQKSLPMSNDLVTFKNQIKGPRLFEVV